MKILVLQTICLESGFRMAQNWPKIGKMTMLPQHANMTPSSIFFDAVFVSLVNFSYWSKLYLNVIIGSGVMITFFYKGLSTNAEVVNTSI